MKKPAKICEKHRPKGFNDFVRWSREFDLIKILYFVSKTIISGPCSACFQSCLIIWIGSIDLWIILITMWFHHRSHISATVDKFGPPRPKTLPSHFCLFLNRHNDPFSIVPSFWGHSVDTTQLNIAKLLEGLDEKCDCNLLPLPSDGLSFFWSGALWESTAITPSR